MHQAVASIVHDEQVVGCVSTGVLTSTTAGSAQFRTTLENILLGVPAHAHPIGARAITLPALLTREQWYESLHRRSGCEAAWLTDIERSVLLQGAAREAIDSGRQPPFNVGPGLIGEMLAFYESLRRNLRTVDAFERIALGELEPSREVDRGADRLLRQTVFLAETFRAYERRLRECAVCDEEHLRRYLFAAGANVTFTRIVVTVHDVVADAVGGLWPADFDLLTRLHGLERIDVVATDSMLDAGYRERLDGYLPGLEEVRTAASTPAPMLQRPQSDTGQGHFLARDREEELVELAHWLKQRARSVREADDGATPVSDRFAVVFQRPLPYLYLARTVLDSARIPYQTFDALPLASEPFAAAVNLVLEAIEVGPTRETLVALMAHPSLSFTAAGSRISRDEVAELNRLWLTRQVGDGRDGLERLAAGAASTSNADRMAAVIHAASAAAGELARIAAPRLASDIYGALLAFLSEHGVHPAEDDSARNRDLRGRMACVATIDGLRDAHRRFGDAVITFAEVARHVRRWIEARTFAPRLGTTGVQLVDTAAAKYGDFDETRLLGLVDGEWPEPRPRNIFYPQSLLTQFGWSSDPDRLRSDRAAFRDLCLLPVRAVSLSSFTLEDDRIVGASPLLESLGELPLISVDEPPRLRRRVMIEEALLLDPIVEQHIPQAASRWLRLRQRRSSREDPEFHGQTRGFGTAHHAVTAVDQYLDCPFRYFAQRVLGIAEEPSDEPQITPLDRGRFLHDVFAAFFQRWQEAGEETISAHNLARARAMFATAVDEHLADLSARDRDVERRRMLGSAVSSGLGERMLQLELERPGVVVERLVEFRLDGVWRFSTGDDEATRMVHIRGTADRIDLMSDGTLWLVDYKSGQAPNRARAIQLPIYGVTSEQRLAGYRGRGWRLGGAAYVAFGDRNPLVRLERRPGDLVDRLREGQRRFLDAVDGIERGTFPPRPAQPSLCDTCPYPAVCRKEFVDGS